MKKAILTAVMMMPAICYGAVGQVSFFVSSECPTGWTNFDGAISTTTYPELYAVIVDSPVWGTYYSSEYGNSVMLPSLEGRFFRAYSTSWNSSNYHGTSRGGYQPDSFQGHFHDILSPGGYNIGRFRSGTGTTGDIVTDGGSPAIQAKTPSTGLNGLPRVSDETRPKNISLLACIQAVSVSSSTTSGGSAVFEMNSDMWFIYGSFCMVIFFAGWKMGRN